MTFSRLARKTGRLMNTTGQWITVIMVSTPVLGCNIHDWMVAYIYVVATPHFAKTTADGKAHLEGLPAGPYEARVWHPRLRGEAMTKPITLADDEKGHITFALPLKPESRPAPRREPYEGPQQSG